MHRVLRGGSWNNNPRRMRVSNRNHNDPSNRNDNIGFRCLRDDGRAMRPGMRPEPAQARLRGVCRHPHPGGAPGPAVAGPNRQPAPAHGGVCRPGRGPLRCGGGA